MYRQSEKILNSNVSSTCPHNMANFCPLTAKIRSGVWEPQQFQRVSHLGFITERCRLITGGQPNYARCLAVSWAATLCIYFPGLLPLMEFCRCKIHFTSKSCVLRYWRRYCTALQQPASAKLCGVVQQMELRNFRRGRQLYSAGRPPRFASAHTLVLYCIVFLCILAAYQWPFGRLPIILNEMNNRASPIVYMVKFAYDLRNKE